MKSRPIHRLQSTPYRIAVFEPSAIDAIVGKKRIGEMSADEYLRLARESQRAMGERLVLKLVKR